MCCSSCFLTGHIKDKYPKAPAPTALLPDWLMYVVALVHPKMGLDFVRRNMGKETRVTSKKATDELGIAFRPPSEAVVDTFESYMKLGLMAPLD